MLIIQRWNVVGSLHNPKGIWPLVS